MRKNSTMRAPRFTRRWISMPPIRGRWRGWPFARAICSITPRPGMPRQNTWLLIPTTRKYGTSCSGPVSTRKNGRMRTSMPQGHRDAPGVGLYLDAGWSCAEKHEAARPGACRESKSHRDRTAETDDLDRTGQAVRGDWPGRKKHRPVSARHRTRPRGCHGVELSRIFNFPARQDAGSH